MFCVNRYQLLMTFNFKNNIFEYFIDFKVPIKKEIYGFMLKYFFGLVILEYISRTPNMIQNKS